MNQLKVFNNLTRQKEDFRPLVPGKVKFYSCGPTTYDFLHVGNARALVVGDLFNRALRALGYEVTFVRNFTDVDDKIIVKAHECQRDPIEHAELFIRECQKDMESLGMLPPDYSPRVTQTMNEIIEMVASLVEKGAAYVVNGEVLYHVPAFKEYGKLSKMDLDGLQHGKRVQVEDYKKHPADFALWKPAKDGEPSWDSPWGKGRPGWHIECSAMVKKYLGETIDLHHGGVDLIFPHHENEIAQSEMANSRPFCLHWCHNEFLNFGKEKMSKSLGNVITIRQFVETYGGMVLRQIFLSCHYRAKVEWNEEVIKQAIHDVERIHEFIKEFNQVKSRFQKEDVNPIGQQTGKDNHAGLLATIEKIKEELANDFNVPAAMSHFFTFIRTVRREYFNELKHGDEKLSQSLFEAIEKVVHFVSQTLGCVAKDADSMLNQINEIKKRFIQMSEDEQNAETKVGIEKMNEDDIEHLIKERKEAKEQKNWKRADEIRNMLREKRIILQDHPDGSVTWKYET